MRLLHTVVAESDAAQVARARSQTRQVGAGKVGVAEQATVAIGADEQCARKARRRKIAAVEKTLAEIALFGRGTRKIDARKLAAARRDAVEAGAMQTTAQQFGSGEIRAGKICLGKIAVLDAAIREVAPRKIDAAQVGVEQLLAGQQLLQKVCVQGVLRRSPSLARPATCGR